MENSRQSRAFRRQTIFVAERRATILLALRQSKWNMFVAAVREFWNSVRRIFQSVPFIFLTVAYGLNSGIYCAIYTLLSQLIKPTLTPFLPSFPLYNIWLSFLNRELHIILK